MANDGSCNYGGMDTRAEVTHADDTGETWRSTCNCGAVTLESGTYDQAVDALTAHRAEAA